MTLTSTGSAKRRGASILKEIEWRSRAVDLIAAGALAKSCGVLLPIAKLLVSRGITDAKSAQLFLNPNLNSLIPPLHMHGMGQAVERIAQALKSHEKLMVHGDYDADGVTSAAVLYRFFRSLGVEPLVHVPNRLVDNHGINPNAVALAIKSKVKLFITSDCGVSSADQVAKLRQAKIDVIITDHHLIPESGPPQEAIIINPSQDVCEFGDQGMSGVGIAFYLVIALRTHLREAGFFKEGEEPNLKEYLDLVTLGTIADQAPLIGQNRIFVKSGLPLLARTEKTGLRVLMNLCLPADRPLSVTDVAFSIAPKLNAAGRLGKAEEAFQLLIEEDPIAAAVLARKLINYNDERRRIEEKHLSEALTLVEERFGSKAPRGLVLYKKEWHHGVLGLVAQKVAQRFRCPTILLGERDDYIKGSGRGYADISLMAILKECEAHLLHFGGHSMAAGVSLQADQVEVFQERFDAVAASLAPLGGSDYLMTDGLLELDSVEARLLDELEKLEPFGEGNPEPKFYAEPSKVTGLKRMGDKQQHLRFILQSSSGNGLSAVAFSMAEAADWLDRPWRVLFTPEYNHWQGRKTLQLRVQQIQVKG